MLSFVVRWATPLMFGGVVVGFFLPSLAAAARPALFVLVIATLTIPVMRTDPATLLAALRRPLLPALLVVFMLVVSPALMHAALSFLAIDPALHGPLVLYAGATALSSMAAFALLFGLDATFVLVSVTLCCIATPLTLPIVAWLVMGDALPLSPGALAGRLAVIVIGGYASGFALRRLLGGARIARWRLPLDATFVVIATVFGIAVMHNALDLTLARPHEMAIVAVTVFGGSLLLILVGALLFAPAGLATALGAGLTSGPRSISIVLAASGAAASDELIMVVAAAQLPIFILPMIQRPLIRWLLARRTARATIN